jgi:hypothetical protein
VCLHSTLGNLSPIAFEHQSASKGFNSAIQIIKANARGYRNFTNYRARIFFIAVSWIWVGLEEKFTVELTKNLIFFPGYSW